MGMPPPSPISTTRGCAGRALLQALIPAAERAGHWKLLARVFPENTGSRALCASVGFREVGVYEKHAQLDGMWKDAVIVERPIPANMPGAASPRPRVPSMTR